MHKIKSTLTKKQYYSRLSRLIKTCLIEGGRGRYNLTSLGVLVNEMEEVLEAALQNYSILKPIDDNTITKAERTKLIETLIDNQVLKTLIIQGYSRLEESHIRGNRPAKRNERRSKSIIAILDDSDTLRTLKIMLNKYGFNVKGFINPYQALEHFIRSGYNNCHLVISDIRLPQLNGIELCQKMGVNLAGILKKPIEEKDLIAAVRNTLG